MLDAIFGELMSLVLVLLALYFLLTLIHPSLGKPFAKALRKLSGVAWRHIVVRPIRAALSWAWQNIVAPAGRWVWRRVIRPGLRRVGNGILMFLDWLGGLAINAILTLWTALTRRNP